MTLPTVKIKHPTLQGEFIIINESDFIPGEHELYQDEPQEKKKSAKKPKPASAGETAPPGEPGGDGQTGGEDEQPPGGDEHGGEG